ncbi:MAG: dTMP kinase [Deltaproteobacteria bacterium]|jgi:dTMP kinase|nr:dTMP kinase [Deltaproteobacteria bacterium]MBW2489511.1 dTMP kinase [Deltaproteobacteria bacterium]MBW2517287.1 dTMP kinase [Deltaproteobacteria bacterium]
MFITLEGIEGSGKTTQIDRLAEFFKERGMACVTTRQPGGTVIGENIRSILLNPQNQALEPMAELLLYLADRAQHINEIIKPALAEGKVVLCDRYFDATVVYQGFARGLRVELLLELHRILFENLKPDVTLLLDLSPQQGLERAWQQLSNGQRAGHESRFENESLAFHEKVRAGYLELAKLEPQRFRIIDAGRGADHVFAQISKTLAPFL